ncbi:MAG: WhiB family transcriptional regulator [Streptosporangiaceae bacterium]
MAAPAYHGGTVQSRSQGRARVGTAGRPHVAAAATSWLEPHSDVAIELPCSTAPDLFFAERPEEIRRARALCQRCPARDPCLDGALQRAEPWGVWGGELILRGSIMPSKRGRGRPRNVQSRPGLPIAGPARP